MSAVKCWKGTLNGRKIMHYDKMLYHGHVFRIGDSAGIRVLNLDTTQYVKVVGIFKYVEEIYTQIEV